MGYFYCQCIRGAHFTSWEKVRSGQDQYTKGVSKMLLLHYKDVYKYAECHGDPLVFIVLL